MKLGTVQDNRTTRPDSVYIIVTASMDGDVSHDLVRAEVSKILRSREFIRSPRLQRFLQFIVEEYLAGRASRIKAYTIAVTVFDRGDDFDPSLHPIVRIEAGRLRRALQYYYLTEGKTARIRIEVPKGGYRPIVTECPMMIGEALPQAELTPVPISKAPPQFRGRVVANLKVSAVWICAGLAVIAFLVAVLLLGHKSDSKNTELLAALPTLKIAQERQPAVMLAPFQAYSGDAELNSFAQGVTDELARYLSENSALDVHYSSGDAGTPEGQTLMPDMFVSGGVRRAGNALLIFVYLTPTAENGVASTNCVTRDELESGSKVDEKSGAARCIAAYVNEAVHAQRLR